MWIEIPYGLYSLWSKWVSEFVDYINDHMCISSQEDSWIFGDIILYIVILLQICKKCTQITQKAHYFCLNTVGRSVYYDYSFMCDKFQPNSCIFGEVIL